MVLTRKQAGTIDEVVSQNKDVTAEKLANEVPANSDQEYRVRYQGRWFDVSNFALKHPGGAEILRKVKGQDIDSFMDGSAMEDGTTHKHSENAYRILDKYAEDKRESEDDLIDIDKPILAQVGKLGKDYWQWIHTPIDKDLRMFESDTWEWFTRNHWHTIPTIWVPVATILAWLSFGMFRLEYSSPGKALFITADLFVVGVFIWTLLEYVLHRYAFHWVPPADSPKLILFHFILHGLHHKTPMDGGRLVFPPLMALGVAIPILAAYRSFLSWPITLAIGAGNFCGYICYDMTHYYLHHGIPSVDSYFDMLKKYHHAHHYKNPDLSYGISSKLWDWPFGTIGASQ